MLACWSPQYSAHCPRYTPGRSAWIHILFVRPEMRSVLPVSCGTQKLWMTSSVVSSTWTVMATNRRGCDSADMSESVNAHRTARTATGTTTPPRMTRRPAQRGVPLSRVVLLRLPGSTPMRISAVTTATTRADTQNMNHHRPAMRCAPGPSGCSVEGEVSPHALAPRASRRVPADLTQQCLGRERTCLPHPNANDGSKDRDALGHFSPLEATSQTLGPSVCRGLLTCPP